MKHTKKLIESAVSGGWKYEGKYTIHDYGDGWRVKLSGITIPLNKAEMLLDPSFWQAVGKDQGWGEKHDGYENENGEHECNNCYPVWAEVFSSLPKHLIDGGDIESFAETLNLK